MTDTIDYTQTRGTNWSVTAFNLDKDLCVDFQNQTKPIPSIIKSFHGGLEECPTTKTIHFQALLKTSQCRFSAIKKIFPKSRIEKGHHPDALLKYVLKPETAVGPKTSVLNPLYMTMDMLLIEIGKYTAEFYTASIIEKNPLCLYDIITLEMLQEGRAKSEWISLLSNPQTKRAFTLYWRYYHLKFQGNPW